MLSFGNEGSAISSSERYLRSAARQAFERGVSKDSGEPLRIRLSAVYVQEQEAVVWARRESWERVTLSEELVGRFNFGSRFPQYLQHLC